MCLNIHGKKSLMNEERANDDDDDKESFFLLRVSYVFLFALYFMVRTKFFFFLLLFLPHFSARWSLILRELFLHSFFLSSSPALFYCYYFHLLHHQ